MVSPVIAQAILGMRGPDVVGAFREGRELAKQEQTMELAGQALQAGGGEALQKLQGINPDIAIQLQNQIGARSAQDLTDFVQSAGIARRMLERGQDVGALNFAQQRLQILQQQGRDTAQTQRIVDLLSRGESGAALAELQSFDDALSAAKSATKAFAPIQFRRPDGSLGFGVPTFDPNTGGTTFEEVEAPEGAEFIARRETPTEAAEKTRRKEEAKLVAKFKLEPQVAGAVALAKEGAKAKGEVAEEQRSNAKARDLYVTSMRTLAESLGGTATGPISGWLPAITTNQQIAEGAIAAMAPIMKQMFRSAGEGTFTDSDQALLMAMLPTRKDNPEAVKSKLENINSIVTSKLGGEEIEIDEPQQTTPAVDMPGQIKFIGWE